MEFWVACSVFLFFLVLESITSWIFIRGSKKHHPELWRHAGEPTLMGNGDMISAWPLYKYLMNRKYQEIEDQSAVVFAEKNRLPFVVTYFGACASIILLFLVILLVGIPN